MNPLKASPDFAPLARGMAAALPYVDEFVEGHSLASLEHLGRRWLSPMKVDRMKEVLDDIERWRAGGHRVAVARVVGVEGSAPRDPGATMAVNDAARSPGRSRAGASRARSSRRRSKCSPATREPGVVTFGYSDDEAFAVGLTCGGTIHLFLEPLDW